MKKITSFILSLLLMANICYSDGVTTNYKLIIPSSGSRDWLEKISNDLISLDEILYEVSSDTATLPALTEEVTIISTDAVDWESTVEKATIISNDAVLWTATTEKATIISNDSVIQDDKLTIISNDSINQDEKITIISNDSAIQDEKILIISTDAVDWESTVEKATIISNDSISQNLYITILSNDSITWKNNRVSNDAVLTNLVIPSGADPDISVEGELAWDSDGDALRGFDGTNQVVTGQATKTITATISDPLDLTESATLPIWHNRTGYSFVITRIDSNSDTDNVDFTLKNGTSTDYADIDTISTIQISADGVAVYYDTATGAEIEYTTITNDSVILFDNDGTDDPGYLSFTIQGYLDANS